jgi:hypothetical protein
MDGGKQRGTAGVEVLVEPEIAAVTEERSLLTREFIKRVAVRHLLGERK